MWCRPPRSRRHHVVRSGSGGCIPPSRRGLSSNARGSSRSCRAPGDERDRVVQNRGAWGTRPAMPRLRHDPRCLQFLPQPALPKMPGTGARGMACRASGRVADGAILPCRLHAAGPGSRDRLPEQSPSLRHLVQDGSRDTTHDRGGPKASGRRDRGCGRASYMGTEPTPSSARALRRAWRRSIPRWHALGWLSTRLLPACARAFPALPPLVPSELASCI